MIRMEDAVLMINRLCIHIHTTKTDRSFHLFLPHSHKKTQEEISTANLSVNTTNMNMAVEFIGV
jgi:hypothetical protein